MGHDRNSRSSGSRIERSMFELQEDYERLNRNSPLFIDWVKGQYDDTKTSEAIERIIDHTAIDISGDLLPKDHPKVVSFRNGAYVAIAAVDKAVSHDNWDHTLAEICGEVLYGQSFSIEGLVVDEDFAMISKRRQLRETMLHRSIAGSNVAKEYKPFIDVLANDAHLGATLDFKNGFYLVAHGMLKLFIPLDRFENETKNFLSENSDGSSNLWGAAIKKFFDENNPPTEEK